MKIEDLKPIVDALIFASDAPISLQKMQQILAEDESADVAVKDIRAVIDLLNNANREQQRGFFLQEVAGGYQYRTRPNYAPWVKKLRKGKPFRLTQSTLETLAIIAYRQPIIRAEIEKIRGVDSGGIIKNLLERSLIKIMGRKNIPGRPFMLGTTKRFLEVFGLEKLADMPSLKEFENLDDAKLPTILRESAGDANIEIDDEGTDQDTVHVTDEELVRSSELYADQEEPADTTEPGDDDRGRPGIVEGCEDQPVDSESDGDVSDRP